MLKRITILILIAIIIIPTQLLFAEPAEPQIKDFNTIIQLEAWRGGEDYDGRHYTLLVTAIDKADNTSSASTEVICPHERTGG